MQSRRFRRRDSARGLLSTESDPSWPILYFFCSAHDSASASHHALSLSLFLSLSLSFSRHATPPYICCPPTGRLLDIISLQCCIRGDLGPAIGLTADRRQKGDDYDMTSIAMLRFCITRAFRCPGAIHRKAPTPPPFPASIPDPAAPNRVGPDPRRSGRATPPYRLTTLKPYRPGSCCGLSADPPPVVDVFCGRSGRT